MWQIICMIIAVFLVVEGILGAVMNVVNAIHANEDPKWFGVILFLTVGLSYLIWFCN